MTVYSFEHDPIISSLLATCRDDTINNRKFRSSIRRIGKYLAHELSQQDYVPRVKASVKSRTGYDASYNKLDGELYKILAIPRAGIVLADGMSDILDCDTGFCYMHRDEHTLQPIFEKEKGLKVENKLAIYADVMIATGGSMELLDQHVLAHGAPKQRAIVGVIASRYAIDLLNKEMPDTDIFVAAIDDHYEEGFMGLGLNGIGYIVPGLGDAGDRCFGPRD